MPSMAGAAYRAKLHETIKYLALAAAGDSV
jgi:hypothetical protein